MTTRRFGPTRGAGVAVVEADGDKTIEPGALGYAGYAGIFEKGRVGEMIVASTRSVFTRKMGGVIDDSLAPDNASDYYNLANGAGGLLLVRVTDGNEAKATNATLTRGDYADVFGGVAAAAITADNGGRWGGKRLRVSNTLDAVGDLGPTTLQLPTAIATDFATDELKGGRIRMEATANKLYEIISNTAAGLLTVTSDADMEADHAGDADLRFFLTLDNDGKAVSIRYDDGEENPDTEFSLEIFLDGDSVKKYGNLSVDTTNSLWWEDVVNNDDSNDYIIVDASAFTGSAAISLTFDPRPANYAGEASALAATLLTVDLDAAAFVTVTSPGGGDPTFVAGTTTDAMIEQTITITMTSATSGTAVSNKLGALGTVTLGTLFNPPGAGGGATANDWAPPLTVTAGGSPLAATDTIVWVYRPLIVNEAVGGLIYPDKTASAEKRQSYTITANTHNTVSVAAGTDMTKGATIVADFFMLSYAQELIEGADGNADVIDSDYTSQAWENDTSPFNQTNGKNLGLVKFATPGVTATAVQKAGAAYAAAKNHQYRYEIPAATTTDQGALDYINNTLGRNDFAVVEFPSYGDVPHPDAASARANRQKRISLTGMIHGREARIAADFNGYHKAQAGIDAVLPRLLKLATGERILNEEILNPAGINVIVKKSGNFVLWGDRTLQTDPQWRFKHQRELMSYYEHVLQENFDFIVFTINDATSDKIALSSLISFFFPEFVKRALRGNEFLGDAAILKVDDEINTDAVRAAGDKKASVSLRLADTTERFIITIGKQGIFENVA